MKNENHHEVAGWVMLTVVVAVVGLCLAAAGCASGTGDDEWSSSSSTSETGETGETGETSTGETSTGDTSIDCCECRPDDDPPVWTCLAGEELLVCEAADC